MIKTAAKKLWSKNRDDLLTIPEMIFIVGLYLLFAYLFLNFL